MDGCDAGSSCGDDGVEEECYFGCGFVWGGGRKRGGWDVVWEVVVVFNWGEGCRFAEETEVVYWSRVGEEGLNCCGIYVSLVSN